MSSMSKYEGTLTKIHEASDEIALIEGRPDGPYLYTSQPGDGQTRVVFRDKVCQGLGEGLAYVNELLAEARQKDSGKALR